MFLQLLEYLNADYWDPSHEILIKQTQDKNNKYQVFSLFLWRNQAL